MKNVNKTKVSPTKLFVPVFLLILLFLPSPGGAQTCTADRYNSSLVFQSTHTTIQAAVNAAATANVIKVSGTCSENVLVREEKARITLDGQGSAAIAGPDGTIATLRIRGNLVTVTGFLSISGGEDGILIDRGGTAVIINNTIQSTGRNGIVVNESAAARIGFSTGNDIVASPNTIQSNPNRGIVVTRHASARIVGNTISGNVGDGIAVTRVSQADIAGNTINGNGADGVLVSGNSGVNLGNDTGTTIFDLPNSTTVNNTGVGVRCAISSYVSGPQGTLNGTSGLMQLSGSCVPRELTDIPMGGTTSGSIADIGGWTITVSDLSPEGMRVSISGAGTRAAQIDMCDAGGAEAVLLDADGETADITCVTTTTGTNASSQVTAAVASPSIEVREPPTGSGTVVMLPQGQTVTIGSPVVASSSNTQPIGVGLVDANNLETAFFALDSNESVDVQPDPSGASNVTVLSGSITMELAGQTATVTLDTDDSVNVQSDPSSGTSDVAVVSGSVIVEVGGQTTTVGVGQTFSLMPVTIDIKPGTFPNTINLGSRGTVPVAILSSATLDARSVNPSTVTVAGAPVQLRGRGIPMASFQDVNGDGLLDLVVHIDTPALQLNSSATEAVLVGSMFDGKTIRGTDSVRIVP